MRRTRALRPGWVALASVVAVMSAALAPAGSSAATAPGSRPEPPRWPQGVAPNDAPLPRTATNPAAAATPITCHPVVGYSVDQIEGSLYRFVDPDPNGATPNAIRTFSRIGSGWNRFAWIGSGGDGVIYALTWTGDLMWFRHNGTAWINGRGRVIGTGFAPERGIGTISVGPKGDIYVVRTDGRLALYRHTGRLTGAATWVNPQGWNIGTGWRDSEVIVPAGGGVIYQQVRGSLIWYRHTDPAVARATWRRPAMVGTGWRVSSIASAGAGRMYVQKYPNLSSTSLSVTIAAYQHTDPLGGANQWSADRGVTKGVLPLLAFAITVDPAACHPAT